MKQHQEHKTTETDKKEHDDRHRRRKNPINGAGEKLCDSHRIQGNTGGDGECEEASIGQERTHDLVGYEEA